MAQDAVHLLLFQPGHGPDHPHPFYIPHTPPPHTHPTHHTHTHTTHTHAAATRTPTRTLPTRTRHTAPAAPHHTTPWFISPILPDRILPLVLVLRCALDHCNIRASSPASVLGTYESFSLCGIWDIHILPSFTFFMKPETTTTAPHLPHTPPTPCTHTTHSTLCTCMWLSLLSSRRPRLSTPLSIQTCSNRQ